MPNSILSISIAALMLAFALPAHAGKADTPAAPETDARPFIEISHLIAPGRVGDFVLEGSSYDDKTKYAGAGFRYALPGHQETRIDVFVYPAGRAPQEQAINSGMVEFKGGIEQAQQAGYIKDLEFVSDDVFPLEAPAVVAASTADTPDPAEARLLAALAATRVVGKRLQMRDTMVSGGFPMYSNGYLFYKQLYFFKVRVSAARDRIDDAQFQALADRAARSLVPALEVANVGACANKVIEISPDADADAFAEALVRRTAEIQGENCFENDAEAELDKKSKDADVVDIHFDVQDWNRK